MAAWSELQARDKLMENFIRQDPVELRLRRPRRVTTAAGGTIEGQIEILEPQIFHVYPFKRRLTIEWTHNPQTFGEEKVEYIHYILIFTRGSDIKPLDWFDPNIDEDFQTDRIDRGKYEITFISARVWDRGQAGALFRG
jgi:hypothetical protein